MLALALALAPTLASWVGFGDVATKVVNVMKEMLGTDDPEHAHAAFEGLSADQRIALQVRLAEIATERERNQQQAAAAAMTAQLDEMRSQMNDIANARARDMEIRKSGGSNMRSNILAGYIMVGIIAVLVMLLLGPRLGLSEGGAIVSGFTIALGVLLNMLKDVVGFEFGSSRGSRDKDASVQTMAETAARAGAALNANTMGTFPPPSGASR